MKLAISSIAWTPASDDLVGEVLRRERVDGVELAPSAYWPDPLVAPVAERLRLREAWAARGFPVVALQALLFGFPELRLFDRVTREPMQERLAGMLRVAADLGARVLVFGSPASRQRGGMSRAAATDVAISFFRRLGDEAARLRVSLCIEPNPSESGCDFVTSAAEGRDLVERVGSPGFRLHLDAAAMFLAGDDAAQEIAQSVQVLGHFHFSAPQLAAVHPGCTLDLEGACRSLRSAGYDGFGSIEMRAHGSPEEQIESVTTAVRWVGACMRKGS